MIHRRAKDLMTTKRHQLTRATNKFITEALAIEQETAQAAGTVGYMARAMVQATLPHKKVAGNEFVRRNGAFTLSLMAPSAIGLPYGTIPRLLLAWMATEAVKTKSRDLELGDSLSAFMRDLGLAPTGGKWGSIGRLKDQTRRLFASTVSASYEDASKTYDTGYRFADATMILWDAKSPDQAGLWKSTVTLTDSFYREITEHPVPIDMRAINALKRSPMALDVYSWLTYRNSYAKKASTIPWGLLAGQFGSEYAQARQFKAAFLDALKKVGLVYEGARFEATDSGLIVKPSPTHITRKP